jgi:hypothetical protein
MLIVSDIEIEGLQSALGLHLEPLGATLNQFDAL